MALQRVAASGVIAVMAICALMQDAQGDQGDPMKLSSEAFSAGGKIPERFTCEGANVSPPLAWIGVPEGTRSLALVVDDPDAPDPAKPQRTWVHWVVYNIPPEASGLGEALKELPAGSIEGINDWGEVGYSGPCPPIGTHRYVHTLHALDSAIHAERPLSKRDLEAAMAGHIMATAQLVGTYRKGE